MIVQFKSLCCGTILDVENALSICVAFCPHCGFSHPSWVKYFPDIPLTATPQEETINPNQLKLYETDNNKDS